MNEFLTYLQHDARNTFDDHEFNDIINAVYTVLIQSVREHADTLTYLPAGFVWSKDGLPIGLFFIVLTPSTIFRDAFETILQRDVIVRNHLMLVAETATGVTYRITTTPPPYSKEQDA
jgi:hypothetical protein